VPKTAPRTEPEPDPDRELAGLSYEQAREELVEVVRTLEAGGTTLEESLALWERGEALAARCQAWLDGARDKLDAAVAGQKDARTDSNPDAGTETGTETER
jgi:exodeoxyribonuclease VII small subunit